MNLAVIRAARIPSILATLMEMAVQNCLRSELHDGVKVELCALCVKDGHVTSLNAVYAGSDLVGNRPDLLGPDATIAECHCHRGTVAGEMNAGDDDVSDCISVAARSRSRVSRAFLAAAVSSAVGGGVGFKGSKPGRTLAPVKTPRRVPASRLNPTMCLDMKFICHLLREVGSFEAGRCSGFLPRTYSISLGRAPAVVVIIRQHCVIIRQH